MPNNYIEVLKTDPAAIMPTYGTEGAAGADLYSLEDFILAPQKRKLISTGISMAIPQHLYGRIAPRSGLAVKHGIDVMAGVVDSDYRGEIKVALINLGDVPYEIRVGDRIAQIIFEMYSKANFAEVQRLGATVRGGDGYGSTGV